MTVVVGETVENHDRARAAPREQVVAVGRSSERVANETRRLTNVVGTRRRISNVRGAPWRPKSIHKNRGSVRGSIRDFDANRTRNSPSKPRCKTRITYNHSGRKAESHAVHEKIQTVHAETTAALMVVVPEATLDPIRRGTPRSKQKPPVPNGINPRPGSSHQFVPRDQNPPVRFFAMRFGIGAQA